MEGPSALDATGREHRLRLRGRRRLLPAGTGPAGLRGIGQRINRAVHLAGGRLVPGSTVPAESYSVELWFWNGLPNDARPVTGYLFARVRAREAGGDALAWADRPGPPRADCSCPGGPAPHPGGKTEISPKTWHHLVLTAPAGASPSISTATRIPRSPARSSPPWGPGSAATRPSAAETTMRPPSKARSTRSPLYDRPLTPAEIARHFRAALARTAKPIDDGVLPRASAAPARPQPWNGRRARHDDSHALRVLSRLQRGFLGC